MHTVVMGLGSPGFLGNYLDCNFPFEIELMGPVYLSHSALCDKIKNNPFIIGNCTYGQAESFVFRHDSLVFRASNYYYRHVVSASVIKGLLDQSFTNFLYGHIFFHNSRYLFVCHHIVQPI